ncbi:hypothetical protein PanWU01x14_138140 [Parasponia andersonii]|uniref:Uncharacterized protein n=1 Tax=Parasponia andersonii TaxID=3476 RepID=A0A2P5CN65_PARAD|nr:hypothetical protein PanWU01x14_138140 [Parasponia andersonii]
MSFDPTSLFLKVSCHGSTTILDSPPNHHLWLDLRPPIDLRPLHWSKLY